MLFHEAKHCFSDAWFQCKGDSDVEFAMHKLLEAVYPFAAGYDVLKDIVG